MELKFEVAGRIARPVEEALFFDHPSGRTRVRMAMEWKARHLAEANARAADKAR